jgi:ABC-type multidrug transport system fused ATPase/permease subunit
MAATDRDTITELQRLGSGDHDDRLRFRLVLRILLRCLPLIRGVRRHLLTLAGVAAVLLLLVLPVAMMGYGVLWNGVLAGEPLPEIQARVLGLDPQIVSHVDALSQDLRMQAFDRFAVIFLGILLLVILPAVGGLTYYYIWICQQINQALRLQLHERLQTLSLRFHAEHRVGDAIYRLFQDSAMVSDLIEALFLTPFLQLGRHLIAAVVVFLIDPLVGAIFLLCWPPMLAVGWWVSKRLRVGFRAARQTNAALTARIQEILAGIKVVKAYGIEATEQASFEQHSRDAFRAAFGVRYLVSLFSVIAFVVICAAMLAATGFALEYTRSGAAVFAAVLLGLFGIERWTLGQFNFFKGEMGSGATAFRVMLRMWARVQDMAIGIDRVFQLLDLEPEVQDAPDAVDFPALGEGVTFRDVSFGYQLDRPVLQGVGFDAHPGSVTAVVGPTGSGKSTLMALLLRLFDPDRGGVEIGGLDLRRVRLADLRKNVSIALQENVLFGASVRENIRYAVPDADDAAVREAARVACADEFVERLPQGYETLLGERGTKLSTGQRQRLSIARAVLKNAPILVLDEPTAALDAETEQRVMHNLQEWGRGRVIFLITHRLSTIRQAEEILVLQDGRLVERGSHAELLARDGGVYRRLVQHEAPEPQHAVAP